MIVLTQLGKALTHVIFAIWHIKDLADLAQQGSSKGNLPDSVSHHSRCFSPEIFTQI
jgi:hypothetical protein